MIDRLHAAEAEVALRAPHVNPRWRMAFHIMAPAGWINDPNGLCWFAGEYHAFFQHHPFSSEWGPMHWGHVVSTDLVSWRHAGIALAPGDASDADGCHSGSAVDNDGELAIVYTGHRYLDPPGPGRDPDRFTQVQNLAVSRDGIQFEKVPGNPVIAAPPADSTHHFRDPKVWREPGGWRLVLGNAAQDGRGRALLYGSSDLRSWELLGIVAESDGATGWMWECPDLFTLDGWDVLLISPMGMGDPMGDEMHTGSLIGSRDPATHRLTHGGYTEMDHGHDFYAAQTLAAPDGRRIGIGWMKPGAPGPNEQRDGWAGALTLPRELHVTRDGQLSQQPIVETALLRTGTTFEDVMEVEGHVDTGVSVEVAEIHLDLELSTSRAVGVGFALVVGDATVVEVILDRGARHLVLDRGGADGVRCAPIDPGTHLRLRVFVDRSSIEVFTGSGLVTMTSRIYPAGSPTLRVVSDGGPTRARVEVHALRDIWAGAATPEVTSGAGQPHGR